MVHSLDDNVGKIMDTLDRLGIADDTIIIFYSDNGGNMYNEVDETTPTSNSPLRGGKATMYEGGIRVPAIVVWPGVVKGGTRNEALVQSEDLYPTITAMAGVRGKPEQACDGLSMAPALHGDAPLRDAVFCFFPHAPRVPDWLPPSVCVRQGDWKLIRIFHGEDGKAHRYELYNLREDIGERHNLAAKNPDKVKALDALIDKFLADTKAVLPQPNPDYDPKAAEVVGGWKTGANGQARISFDRRRKAMHCRAFGNAPMLVTAEPLSLPPGRYRFEVRMEALAGGDGMVSCSTTGKEREATTAASFTVRHDRKWRDCQAELQSDQPIAGLQLVPCAGQGTVLIKWVRLHDSGGKLVKEWEFDKAPPKRAAKRQPVVGGWQAGPNGHATCRLKGASLHMAVSKGDPMLMTARPLTAGPGEYVLSIRMMAKAKGGGQVFGRPSSRGYQRGRGKAFAAHHDGKWHEYDVKLDLDHPLHQIRLDPCAGAGELEIGRIRLSDVDGKMVREWTFEAP